VPLGSRPYRTIEVVADVVARAFSDEVDTGSSENATKQSASALIRFHWIEKRSRNRRQQSAYRLFDFDPDSDWACHVLCRLKPHGGCPLTQPVFELFK